MLEIVLLILCGSHPILAHFLLMSPLSRFLGEGPGVRAG
jgi:hypothetical protein